MQFQISKKRIAWGVGCCLALLSLVYMGRMALSDWFSPPPPPIPVAAKAPKTSKPPLPTSKPVKDVPAPSHPEPGSKPAEGAAPTAPAVPVAGNLAVMTTLRAQLEEARIRVAIAQEQDKLQPKPVVVSSPVAQPKTLALPDLPKSTLAPTAKKSSPVVVSVQGVDGHSTATVRLGSGELVSLRQGDHFSGGVISAISRNGVTIRRGSTSTTLAFE